MAMPPSRAPQIVSLAIAQKLLDRAAPPSAWGLSAEQFQIALERSAAQRFSSATPAAPPSANAVEKYLDTLNLSDLALASACSAGNSAAWDFFVANFRPELYRAARVVIRRLGCCRIGRAGTGRFHLCRALRPARIRGPKEIAPRLFPRPQQADHMAARDSRTAPRGSIPAHPSHGFARRQW